MQIREKINQLVLLIQTKTFRQSLLTVSTVGINGILGAIFFICIARMLGPSEYGVFALAIASLTLIADIADFGTNTGIVRFVPGLIKHQPADAYRMLKLSLEIKAVVWCLVLLVGFFLIPFIVSTIFGKVELIFPLQLSLIGVGGAMFYTYTQSVLQAFEKYRLWSFLNLFTNGLRLFITLVLSVLVGLNVFSGLLLYISIPFIGFLIGCSLLPIRQIVSAQKETNLFKDFRSYNSYIAIFTLIAAFSSRIDMYLAAKLLNPDEVGIYGAAVQLNSFIPQIMGGLGVVVAPKFASFTTQHQMIGYLKKLQLLVLGCAAVFVLFSPLASVAIPWFYGTAYASLPTIFYLYFSAMLIYLISVPVHTAIFYYFSKPQVFIYVAIGQLTMIAFLGTYLTNRFGLVGLALAVVTGMVFNLVVPLFYVLMKLKGR
jgi:O-antigen/teichoic acid export membrane protein